MAERKPGKGLAGEEQEGSHRNASSDAIYSTGDPKSNNTPVNVESSDTVAGSRQHVHQRLQDDESWLVLQSEMTTKPIYEVSQESVPLESTSFGKRKSVHLDALDCSELAQTEAGGLALKNPSLVRTSSKDSNRGLYPRPPRPPKGNERTVYMPADVCPRLSQKRNRSPRKVSLTREQMKNQRKMEEFFPVSSSKRSKSDISPNKHSPEGSTPLSDASLAAPLPRSISSPFPKKKLNPQFASMRTPHSLLSQAKISSHTVLQNSGQQSTVAGTSNFGESSTDISPPPQRATSAQIHSNQNPGPSGSVQLLDADNSQDGSDPDIATRSSPPHKVNSLPSLSPESQIRTPTIFAKPSQSPNPSPSKSVKSSVESDIDDFLNDDSWNECQLGVYKSPVKIKSDPSFQCSQKTTPTKCFLKLTQSPGPSPSKSVKSSVESDIEDFLNDDSWNGCQLGVDKGFSSPEKVTSDRPSSQHSKKTTPIKCFLKPTQSPGPSPSKSVKSSVESDIEDFLNDDSWNGCQLGVDKGFSSPEKVTSDRPSSQHSKKTTPIKCFLKPTQSPGPSPSKSVKSSVESDIEDFLNDDSWNGCQLGVDKGFSSPEKVTSDRPSSQHSKKTTPIKCFLKPTQSPGPSPSKSVKSSVESDIKDFLNDDSWNGCQLGVDKGFSSPEKVTSDRPSQHSKKTTPIKCFLKPTQSLGPSPSKSVKSSVESDIEDFHSDRTWDGYQAEIESVLPTKVMFENQSNPGTCSSTDVVKVDLASHPPHVSCPRPESVKNSVDIDIEAFETDSFFDDADPGILDSDKLSDCSSFQLKGSTPLNTFGLLGEGSASYSDEDSIVPGFDQLPLEVLERIFCFVPMSACLHLSLVCKTWNAIISKKDFMPWKKTYHQLRMNSLDDVAGQLMVITHNQEETEDSCLLLLVRNMPKFKAHCGPTMDKDLKRHPKYNLAKAIIKSRMPELLLNEILNPWSTVCLLVILSETVQDVLHILDCLLQATASCTTIEVLECLYCIAAHLWKYKLRFGLNGGCHYRVYHALFLFENSHASVSVENSGHKAAPKHVPALQQYRMHPTHEQSDIINFDIAPGEVVKVVAFAGTGKTLTLVKYAEQRPNTTFLYVAFNKSVMQRSKDIFPENVTSKTTHSLAYAAVGWKYKKKLDASLNPFYLHKLLPPGERKELPWLRYASLVCKTLERFCASDMGFITTHHVPPDYYTHTINGDQIVSQRHVLNHLLQMKISNDAECVWEKMVDPRNMEARITHDVYLKLYQLSKPKLLQYDCLLIDEAQDLTPAQQDIFLNQRGAKILVGDPRQQIYSFRGANDAMNRVIGQKTFHLTQSFRFGTEIAYVANCLLERGTSSNASQKRQLLIGKREPGYIEGKTVGKKVIITRTNVSLFTEAVKIVQANSTTTLAFVGGLDRYGFDVILDIYQLMKPENERERIINHHIWVHKSYRALKTFANETDNGELMNKIRIVDLYHIRIPELVKKIRQRERPESMADIILSTAHKSKGLEFDTVQITDDFGICESRLGTLAVLERDELNLVYVAVTRAKKSLILTQSLLKFIGDHPTLEKFAYPAAAQPSSDQTGTGTAAVCLECKKEIPNGCIVLLSKKTFQLTCPTVRRPGGFLCPQCSVEVYPSFRCFLQANVLQISQNSQ